MDVIRVGVTGVGHELPELRGDVAVEWVEIPTLRYEAIDWPRGIQEGLIAKPFDWIIFSSRRSLSFFSDFLKKANREFPVESQIACIGESTARFAEEQGWFSDFYPTESGSEGFLKEFEDLISNNRIKPRVFMPSALNGRRLIADRLRELGCEVCLVPIYQGLRINPEDSASSLALVNGCDALILTSPTQAEAFLDYYPLRSETRLIAMGDFTNDHLRTRGFEKVISLPNSDFSRLGEIL